MKIERLAGTVPTLAHGADLLRPSRPDRRRQDAAAALGRASSVTKHTGAPGTNRSSRHERATVHVRRHDDRLNEKHHRATASSGPSAFAGSS